MKTRMINVIKITYLSFFVSIITLSILHKEAHSHWFCGHMTFNLNYIEQLDSKFTNQTNSWLCSCKDFHICKFQLDKWQQVNHICVAATVLQRETKLRDKQRFTSATQVRFLLCAVIRLKFYLGRMQKSNFRIIKIWPRACYISRQAWMRRILSRTSLNLKRRTG